MSQESAHSDAEPRLRVLDAFRAIAILGVLVHHYLSRYAPPDHVPSLYGYANRYPQWLDLGAMGVQFFFIISGFVIFMSVHRCDHLLEFWTRRLARLYPAYIAATITTFVVVNAIGPAEFHSGVKDVLVGLAFLSPYVPGTRFVEPAYWSLVVEMQFYVCIGILFTVFHRRFELAWTLYICAGIALWILGRTTPWTALGSLSRHVFLAAYAPYFTAGMVFYQLYTSRREGRAAVGVWAMSVAAFAEYVTATPQLMFVQHLLTGAMIVAFALFIGGRLKWLATGPLVFIGGISYSLYLLHQYIGVSLIPFFTRALHLPDLVAFAAVAGICGIMAYAFTRWIETPAKRALLTVARHRLFPKLAARWPALAFGRRRTSESCDSSWSRGAAGTRIVRP